jgi:hypothetical protein
MMLHRTRDLHLKFYKPVGFQKQIGPTFEGGMDVLSEELDTVPTRCGNCIWAGRCEQLILPLWKRKTSGVPGHGQIRYICR